MASSIDPDIIKAAMDLARKSSRDTIGNKLFDKKPALLVISQEDDKPELEESPEEEALESPAEETHEDSETDSPLYLQIARILRRKKS
jgi:hypothetical protein